MMKNWTGKRVLILGAARQGLALARFLADHKAQVILNDRSPASSKWMKSAIQSLSSYPQNGDGSIQWVLGEHPLQLLDGIDLLCISGGIPLDIPLVLEAQKRNITLSNDTQIFMELVPCPVIGITGSAGKTTTTALSGKILESLLIFSDFNQLWVGGNIGVPLIDRIEEIQAQDLVLLEMSSFQLELMSVSPAISAILNITPNHLDRHGTLQAYTEAKSHILTCQKPDDVAILNRDDAGSWNLRTLAQGKLVSFGCHKPAQEWAGTYLHENNLYYHNEDGDVRLISENEIPLRGKHNVQNTLAACLIVITTLAQNGIQFNPIMIEQLQKTIRSFNGVPHRLELIKTHNDVQWVNDSIATSPERTIAALHSFDEPLVLLLGGHDKDLPWQDLARLVTQRVKHVIIFGEAANLIFEQIQKAFINAEKNGVSNNQQLSVTRCQDFTEAVYTAYRVAQPGDVVLLSPGAASYDEFKDFEERGERFKTILEEITR